MKPIQLVFLLFTLATLRAQEPDVVVLKAPKPPAVLLKDNVARIRVDMAPDSARHPFAPRLKSAIEQALKSDFVLSDSRPDAILTVGILNFEAPVGRETMEMRQCMELPCFNCRPDRCEPVRKIPFITPTVTVQRVQHWQASGTLSLRVKLMDQKNSVEDNFDPTFKIGSKFIVAVNGKVLRKTQSNTELLEAMLEGAARMVKGQYAFGFDERPVTLSTQKELDLGNGYAAAGDWKAAKESWERADAHKTGADRSFSLGVAQEALAYENYAATRKFDEPKQMLKVALQSYKESLDGAGKDRNKQQRSQLCLVAVPKSIGYLDELEKLQQIRELAAQAAAEAAPAPTPTGGSGGKNLDDAASTPESKKFRELLERQITAIPGGKPSEEQQQRWRTLGETAFKMSPEGSRKVVEQVIAGRKDSMVRMEQYRDSLTLYLADKVITKKEREDLKTLQDALQLTPEAVAEVEGKLRPFTEEGVDAPPVVRPTNPRPRPVVK